MATTLWKGHLTFGLISVPIKLFRAARAEKVHMHNLRRETGTRVRQVFVDREEIDGEDAGPVNTPEHVSQAAEATARREKISDIGERIPPAPPVERVNDRAIPKSDLVRGFEYDKGKYVEFEPGELDKLAPKSSPDMQIVEFVNFAEVDPVYLESSYYVVADKGGEKPYALLYEALRKTGRSAIAEFVMHRRDQTIILRAGRHGIIGHTLFYEDEVKRENEFHADAELAKPKETELAIQLIGALTAPFEPEKFKDKYRERLQAAISEKLATGAGREVPQAGHAAPVIDIMAALKESLAKARKPAASEVKQSGSSRKLRTR